MAGPLKQKGWPELSWIGEPDSKNSRKKKQNPRRRRSFRKKLIRKMIPLVQMRFISVRNVFLLLFLHPGCSLPDIIKEIAKEDEEKHKRHIRRIVAKEERLKARPPRLGKHKYACSCCCLLTSFLLAQTNRKQCWNIVCFGYACLTSQGFSIFKVNLLMDFISWIKLTLCIIISSMTPGEY